MLCVFYVIISTFVPRTPNLLLPNYIPLLIASTGSNFEAEMAGRIPEINPINAAKPVPISILLKLKTNSKSKTLLKIIALSLMNLAWAT
jgi:hypothetical protein